MNSLNRFRYATRLAACGVPVNAGQQATIISGDENGEAPDSPGAPPLITGGVAGAMRGRSPSALSSLAASAGGGGFAGGRQPARGSARARFTRGGEAFGRDVGDGIPSVVDRHVEQQQGAARDHEQPAFG